MNIVSYQHKSINFQQVMLMQTILTAYSIETIRFTVFCKNNEALKTNSWTTFKLPMFKG